jgi:hypothetical protein
VFCTRLTNRQDGKRIAPGNSLADIGVPAVSRLLGGLASGSARARCRDVEVRGEIGPNAMNATLMPLNGTLGLRIDVIGLWQFLGEMRAAQAMGGDSR